MKAARNSKLLQAVEAVLKGYLGGSAKVLLAASGGLDSQLLFSLLLALPDFEFGLAHVNYGLRSDADDAEKFLRSEAAVAGLRIHVLKATEPIASFEAWARELRYSYFAELAQKHNYNAVLTAHHFDDQLETILMRKRQSATGLRLLGISQKNGQILRPLLDFSRADILAEAKASGLNWIEDPSNVDRRFFRNRIRQDEMPGIRNDKTKVADLADMAKNARKLQSQVAQELDALAEVLTEWIAGDWYRFGRYELKKLSEEALAVFFQKYAVKGFYERLEFRAPQRRRLIEFVQSAESSKQMSLNRNLQLSIGSEEIWLFHRRILEPQVEQALSDKKTFWKNGYFEIQSTQKPEFNNNKREFILGHSKRNGLRIRQFRNGDRIFSYSLKKKVKLAHLFSNAKMNFIQKKMHPLLVDEQDRVLWVPELAHSDISINEKNCIKIVWTKNTLQ